MWRPKFLSKLIEDRYDEEYDDVFENEYDEFADDIYESHGGVTHDNGARDDRKSALDDNEDEVRRKDENGAPPNVKDSAQDAESLPVDVYQTSDEIVIRAMMAGIPANRIDISLTREMITITGDREEVKEVTDDNYFYRELSWGVVTRTIMLPDEVEVDEASAKEKHGILTIRLPKINKGKKARIKVKSG